MHGVLEGVELGVGEEQDGFVGGEFERGVGGLEGAVEWLLRV